MAVLIDAPRWPAHGTHFAHLVSDASLDELFEFADAQALPGRAFDHDHYDVPARRHGELVTAGAEPVDEKTLLRRLRHSGLRVRPKERTPTPSAVLPGLRTAWAGLLPDHPALGTGLLHRWQESGRHYHDVVHLAMALEVLERVLPAPSPAARLALWFHDAVYTGTAGADEAASAELAVAELGGAGVAASEIDEVARLVLLTADHRTTADDRSGAAVLDADLAVLGSSPGRYHVYARDVRLEYPEFSDTEFATGRLAVLDRLLARPRLFQTEAGHALWAEAAAANLASEHRRWSRLAA